MTPNDLFDEFSKGFASRKFTAGLLVAMIDFLTELGVPGSGLTSYNDFVASFPRQAKTAAGKYANTLIVLKADGKTLSLRGFYNAAERYFRAEHKRFDYPSAAPHATQAWSDYTGWIDSLVKFDANELNELRERVNQFVLDTLTSQEFDPASVDIEPPLFLLLLANFTLTAKRGEPTGAPFQGITFGFLRADNPHLQIEIEKVRTGSKRLQRVGDVDCWEGKRLAISAEAKQFEIKETDIPDFENFANEIGRRGALGIVTALSFQAGARERLEALGLKPLDLDDLQNIVELWDPFKQRTAVQSFIYYARHVEKNSSLSSRIDEFLATASGDWLAARKALSTKNAKTKA